MAAHVGGVRVLALPLIRVLALISGYVWVLLAPEEYSGWDAVDTTLLAFLLYCLLLIAALWYRPGLTLRFNLPVLLVDLLFALTLIYFSGGAQSTLFLALLLIAGLQSYYYGIRRGILVAAGSAAAYLAVVWPTIAESDWANLAIRIAVLLGTSVGVGILADVEESERLKVLFLSAQAREREQFIRSVVESLGEGVIALDGDGRVVAWNQAMETRYRIPAGDVLGRTLFEVNPHLKSEALAEPLTRLLRGEIDHFDLEAMEHQTLRGSRVILNIKASALRLGGPPAGAVLLLDDITERLAMERSARQTEKLAGLGTLSAGLAHELNNPIGIISSRIELMLLEAEAQGLSEGLREDLRVLHRHAQRVARIVHGLLSFARQSGGAHGSVDLNRLIDETLLLMEKQVSREGIRLVRRLAPDLPPIHGDTNALQQVLMNLIINARDALPDGGEITIETETVPNRPDTIQLVVRDTGPGIPAAVLPRIFDPFFTTKPTGTGLGLSISYGIVRDHHGTLDVESTPGGGTAFVMTFPVGEAPA